MNAANVAEMLRKDREEWAVLTAVLDAEPDRTVHQDGHDWTARDVYNHFARWLAHSTNDFEATLRGERAPRLEGTDDQINARWHAEDSKLTLEEARVRAQHQFDRRLQAIESLPEDRWTEPLWAIAHADGWEHIAAHRRYVEGG
jgi:hypothetical protein